MKRETFVEILKIFLNADSEAASLLYNDMETDEIVKLLGSVPLADLDDVICFIEPSAFEDNFGSIEEYRDFKNSTLVRKIYELDNGYIVIIE